MVFMEGTEVGERLSFTGSRRTDFDYAALLYTIENELLAARVSAAGPPPRLVDSSGRQPKIEGSGLTGRAQLAVLALLARLAIRSTAGLSGARRDRAGGTRRRIRTRSAVLVDELSAAVPDACGDDDQRDRADGSRDSRAPAREPSQKASGGDHHEDGRRNEQRLRHLCVRVQRPLANDILDALFLFLAGFNGCPCTRGERECDRKRNAPRPSRSGSTTNRPNGTDGKNRQEKRDHHREVHHRRVQRIGQH